MSKVSFMKDFHKGSQPREESAAEYETRQAAAVLEEMESAAELLTAAEGRQHTVLEVMSLELVRTRLALEEARATADLRSSSEKIRAGDFSRQNAGLIYLRSVSLRTRAHEYARTRAINEPWKYNFFVEEFLAGVLADLGLRCDLKDRIK